MAVVAARPQAVDTASANGFLKNEDCWDESLIFTGWFPLMFANSFYSLGRLNQRQIGAFASLLSASSFSTAM